MWCPCHGTADVPCTLRGHEPVMSRVLCDCDIVHFSRRNGVLIATHRPGCELRGTPPSVLPTPPAAPEEHFCHVPRCGKRCKPEMLMCAGHWWSVPKHLQAAVYRTYRVGQCDDKSPSAAWHVAADAAIKAAVQAEQERAANPKSAKARRVLPGQLSFEDDAER